MHNTEPAFLPCLQFFRTTSVIRQLGSEDAPLSSVTVNHKMFGSIVSQLLSERATAVEVSSKHSKHSAAICFKLNLLWHWLHTSRYGLE